VHRNGYFVPVIFVKGQKNSNRKPQKSGVFQISENTRPKFEKTVSNVMPELSVQNFRELFILILYRLNKKIEFKILIGIPKLALYSINYNSINYTGPVSLAVEDNLNNFCHGLVVKTVSNWKI
jgi:hypothetical protein